MQARNRRFQNQGCDCKLLNSLTDFNGIRVLSRLGRPTRSSRAPHRHDSDARAFTRALYRGGRNHVGPANVLSCASPDFATSFFEKSGLSQCSRGLRETTAIILESSGISVGLSRCSRCPIWCADATHTQNLAKSDPATTPAPWTVQWHLKALKSTRRLRRNRISPRSFPRDTCDNLRPNRPWRSPRVKNQAIELANSSHWRGRCSHVDSVEKSAYAKHLRTNKGPPLPRSDQHLCPKSHIFTEIPGTVPARH